jgi:hypothetical protein
MPRRHATVALSILVVASLSCSRSEHAAAPAVRPLSAIWGEVLTQRDTIHEAFVKDLVEVNHKDCSDVGTAARRIDELASELMNVMAAGAGGKDEGSMRALGNAVTRLTDVVGKIRESALAEAPGAWLELRFPLDFALREIEHYFTGDVLGQQSVTSRPGFETQPLPPPPSPI